MVSETTNTHAAAGINVRSWLDALPRFNVIAAGGRLRVYVKHGRSVSAAARAAERALERYAVGTAVVREIVERIHAVQAARDARAAEDGRELAPRTIAPPGALAFLVSARPVHGPPAFVA